MRVQPAYPRLAALLWLGFSLAACTGPSPAGVVKATESSSQIRPDFSGHWLLNRKASDNPEEKMKAAMQTMRRSMGGGRGMGGMGGGMGGRKGGGGQRMEGMSGEMAGRSEMVYREMLPLMVAAETLVIAHQEPVLLIGNGGEQRQRIFTDFRGASVSASGGPQQRVTVAGWEGVVLVVETTLNSGARLVQRYQIDSSTGQLKIANAAALAEMAQVSYQLVYDREG